VNGRTAVLTGQQSHSAFAPVSGVLQRKCAGCGNHTTAGGACEGCKKKNEGILQRAAAGAGPVSEVPDVVHDVLSSPGRPLDSGTRAFMEPRFGHDFSRVRVHIDAKASASARAVNALAYTVGRDVIFGAGQYAPETTAGRHLIAHELTHVRQQQQGASAALDRMAIGDTAAFPASLLIGATNNQFEREADKVADAIVERHSIGRIDVMPVSQQLQRACGPSAIGSVGGCIGAGGQDITDLGSTSDNLYLFEVNCDQFRPGEELRLREFARGISPDETVELHGFASEEGDATFNDNLSCARTHAAADILNQESVTARMVFFNHGATPGVREYRRGVVISRLQAQAQEITTHRFRVAAASFLSCAECNPFTDDGTLGVSPPATEPPSGSSFRQLHTIEAVLGTTDGRTIQPGSERSAGSMMVGESGYCGTTGSGHVVTSAAPGTATPIVSAIGVEGIEFESELNSRVGATVPATLPLAPCGYLGTNPMVPYIGNRFKMRLFADGTKESEFVSATLYPSHFLYEDGTLKMFGGSPVHPAIDFYAWATSGRAPMAAVTIGMYALRYACCHPLLAGIGCPTVCVSGLSMPSAVGALMCVNYAQTLALRGCPPSCAAAGSSCTPLVGPSNP